MKMGILKIGVILLWGLVFGYILVGAINYCIFQLHVPSIEIQVQNVISINLIGAIIPVSISCIMAFYLLHSQALPAKNILFLVVFLFGFYLSLSKVEREAIVLTFPLLGFSITGFVPAILSFLFIAYRREKSEIELTRRNFSNSIFLSYSSASLGVIASDLFYYAYLSPSLYSFRIGGAGVSDAIFLVGVNSATYLTVITIFMKLGTILHNIREEDRRSLALVLSGAILGSIPSMLAISLTLEIVIISALALGTIGFLLLLYGIGILQFMYCNYVRANRWKQPLRIGILFDMEWDIGNPEIYAWSDVSPDEWKKALGKFAEELGVRVKIDFIHVTDQFDYFAAIINPYGGVYPEINLKNMETLNKILDFVREGGIFVNVADIPSYWAYNPDLGRKLDITKTVYATLPTASGIQIISTKPFELTPLIKTLGLRVVGISKGFQQDLSQVLRLSVYVISRRAAIVESNVNSCVPTVKLQYMDGNFYEMSGLFFVKYSEGDFLLSLIWINDRYHNQQHKDAIKDAISKLLIDKLVTKAKK